MPKLTRKKITKREFLKLSGISGASLLTLGSLSDELLAQVTQEGHPIILKTDQCPVYHTSSRKRRSCRACKGHAVNRIYSSRRKADEDRAHPGCKCRVVTEWVGWRDYAKAFWPSSRGGAEVYDRRWGWPPPLPAGLTWR
jgi:hypothetical protein